VFPSVNNEIIFPIRKNLNSSFLHESSEEYIVLQNKFQEANRNFEKERQ
jgi:hypothetical protein